MKFRRLYWVTERLAADGSSAVAGVYTSIPDLIERGLGGTDGRDHAVGLRLSLVKLDSSSPPLRTWTASTLESFEEDMREYVLTKEFGEQECRSLGEALRAIARPS